jgi:hypothetical protein
MSEQAHIRRRDLRTCRACGHVFHHVHGSCPACGALRDHRRKKPSKALRDRIDYAFWRARRWLRRYRHYLYYIGGGIFFALVVHPLILRIGAKSRPDGWREARDAEAISLGQLFDAYLAAGQTLVGWIGRGVANAAAWVGDSVVGFVSARPATVVAVLVGAGIGAALAWYRGRRRHRRHHRNHQHRRSPSLDPSKGAAAGTPSATERRSLKRGPSTGATSTQRPSPDMPPRNLVRPTAPPRKPDA